MTAPLFGQAMEQELAALMRRDLAARDDEWLETALTAYSTAMVHEARLDPLPPIDPRQFDADLAWLERPAFVVGHPRSGTTLLRQILDGHPQMLVLPTEVRYFGAAERWGERVPKPSDVDAFAAEWIEKFVEPLEEIHFLLGGATPAGPASVRFARHLIAWQAQLAQRNIVAVHLTPLLSLAAAYRDTVAPGTQPRCWVDKTPLNELHASQLSRLPHARFIHLVRDPADTLLSMLAWTRATGQVPDATELAWRIARSLRSARHNAALLHGRYLIVRYEDLVSAPAWETVRIREFLGIDAHACLQQPTHLGEPARSNSSFAPGEAGAIRRARHARALTPDEAAIVRSLTNRLARDFGYDTSPDVSPLVSLRHQASVYPHVLWSRLRRQLAGRRPHWR